MVATKGMTFFELFGAVMKGGGDISVELEEANTQLTQELDEVENARVQLLKFAVKAMGTAEMLYPDVDADGAFTAGLAAELKETCSSVKAVTVKDRVLQVLDDPEADSQCADEDIDILDELGHLLCPEDEDMQADDRLLPAHGLFCPRKFALKPSAGLPHKAQELPSPPRRAVRWHAHKVAHRE